MYVFVHVAHGVSAWTVFK